MMMNIISGSSSNAAGIMAFIPPLPPDEHSFQSHLIIPNHHLNYEDSMLRRSSACSSFAGIMPWDHDDDTWLSDEGSLQLGEKKKKKKKKSRVSADQVKALEKSFQLSTKLEPERKMQLARDLGLQPRQIAIWFQNRRARSKSKQLEKDASLCSQSCPQISQQHSPLPVIGIEKQRIKRCRTYIHQD